MANTTPTSLVHHFCGAHFSKATEGSSHHLFPQLHCAIRDVPHHPTRIRAMWFQPWEVGKGYSHGEVRYDALQEINISHLAKFGKSSSKWTFQGIC